ncbi:MAG: hypothetical protein KDC24_12340, partial [Saprospiraceae bacterium]|nr:hypothetical protein [Saprospiraceae bacterium]
MKNLAFLLPVILFVVACGNPSENSEATNDEETAQTEETAGSQYTLTPFSPSPSFDDAAINEMKYEGKKFTFGIGGSSYQLGVQTSDAPQKMCANSAQGQHIHLIVDNEPYAAKYEPTFDYEIADGEHYVLAFLSRSYHESIKTDAAHKAVKVNVKDGAFTSEEPITAPMLFYSRPKGTYVGKAETDKVMLDFYIVNATLGSDYKVKVEINGEEAMTVDSWQPYYVEGMQLGDNRIKLTLVDGEGNAVNTPLNPVERT